jgi:hypothetical protein
LFNSEGVQQPEDHQVVGYQPNGSAHARQPGINEVDRGKLNIGCIISNKLGFSRFE